MKKAITLITISTLFFVHSYGQSSFVNGTLCYYDSFKGSSQSTTGNIENNGSDILPSIGYYVYVKKDLAAGIEIGYSNQKGSYSVYSQFADIGQTDISSVRNNVYYAAPACFETFRVRNYLITSGISIPVTYTVFKESIRIHEMKYISSNEVYAYQEDRFEKPNELSVGLYANIGLKRRVFRNLHCGPELGFGFNYVTNKGDFTQNTAAINNGVSQNRSSSYYSKGSRVDFGIRPTFSVSYFFGQ